VEHHADLKKIIGLYSGNFGIELSDSQVDQFLAYLVEIIRWNKITNITAITEPKHIVIKHFLDSLTALKATDFVHGGVVCDIGSGAGLPGIPIKIVRPDLKIVLVEPNKKKSSFLVSIIGQLRLEGVFVFSGSIAEYIKHPSLLPIDIAVLRALRLDEVGRFIAKILGPNGKIVTYRTSNLVGEEPAHDLVLESMKDFVLPEDCGKRIVTIFKSAHSGISS
jgi:16S rRNA (guanine527-N7)-methyltransferase